MGRGSFLCQVEMVSSIWQTAKQWFGYEQVAKADCEYLFDFSQNIRKGSRGLTELLREEGKLAYEERKENAKQLGEEAGTKLLLPMIIMLSIVLVIILVPSFLSF